MSKPPAETLNYMRTALEYDPETGALTWAIPPREGEPAGSVHKSDGSFIVGVDYQKYLAGHIALFLDTGEWPVGCLVFNDGDRTNIARHNIGIRELSRDPKAIYARTLRDRRQQERAEMQRILDGSSTVAGVRRTTENGIEEWLACNPLDVKIVRGSFPTRAAAEYFQHDFAHAEVYVRDHPAPYLGPELSKRRAGPPNSMTLAQAHTLFCYEPESGNFYYRLDRLSFHRADKLNTRKRPVVSIFSRQYPAAMLAWFMTHHVWPPRKALVYRDGDPKNVMLANLLLPPTKEHSAFNDDTYANPNDRLKDRRA